MNITNISGSTLVSGGTTELIGYSFKATADAEIVFKSGDNSSGTGVIYLLLGADQSVRDEFVVPVEFREGLYVDVVSGTVSGAVWVV